jgi:hypothetical protein
MIIIISQEYVIQEYTISNVDKSTLISHKYIQL